MELLSQGGYDRNVIYKKEITLGMVRRKIFVHRMFLYSVINIMIMIVRTYIKISFKGTAEFYYKRAIFEINCINDYSVILIMKILYEVIRRLLRKIRLCNTSNIFYTKINNFFEIVRN